MHSQPLEEPGPLVRRAAKSCLADVAQLADTYVAELTALAGYSESDIPRDELYATAVSALKNMLSILTGSQDRSGLESVSDNLGRRRARQGVPLDSLLRAVRLDFPFLWRALRAQVPSASQAEFAEDVVTVWDTIETHVGRVQASYIAELGEMNRELEVEHTYLLRRLLVSAVDDPALRAHAAAELGLNLETPYVAVVASPNHRQEFRPAVRAVSPRIRIHTLDGWEFVLLEEASLSPAHRRLLENTPLGLAPLAVRMEQLPVMWKLATRLAGLVPQEAGHAAVFSEQWPLLPDGKFAEELRMIGSALLESLFEQPETDVENLLQTALHIMSSGNVSSTAAYMFCHRNTILNRLRRFTSLTGLDPTLPSDAGLIRLLLAARSGDK